MEDNRVRTYVRSLERTIEIDHHYIEEAVEDLQEMCRIVSPDRSVPAGVIVDIRERYKLTAPYEIVIKGFEMNRDQ
ncbi:MAG: hypothetical protein A2156_10955 [Deltaproteobacteria bacterium RBG_16_48_10]|nr:MAG: hypothetical protein A2156_10955 [Deltaproteobacteria bacterium RBG_16_48_10]